MKARTKKGEIFTLANDSGSQTFGTATKLTEPVCV